MKLTPVTDGVSLIVLPPLRHMNVYLVGEVLVDAGLGLHARGILRALGERTVTTHVVTHAHGDHVGGSKTVSEALGVPVCCGPGDVDAVKSGKPTAASPLQALFRWKPVTVARELREGDEVGVGFTVLDVAGHSPGQIALWRERDRTLICADVFLNLNFYTALPGLHEPPRLFNWDPARNRDCARRLAALEPQLTLFGHGRPLRDPAQLRAFADSLPDD
jgi:glyoxylase-like metal-dependent hydrolase (beta-lactamase superfamily II)